MPKQRCRCGAKYNFAESSLGKKTKCKKCGAVFVLTGESPSGGAIPVAGDSESSERPEPLTSTEFDQAPHPPDGLPPLVIESAPLIPAANPSRGYADSVLWSFLFLSRPANLASFLILWAGLALGQAIPFWPISVLILLWFAAFRFAVVASAAAGEQDIPSVGFSGDVLDEYIFPIVKWMGSWIVVMIPAFGYLVVMSRFGLGTMDAIRSAVRIGVFEMIRSSSVDLAFKVLVCLGVFLWPMVILCMALGGFGTVLRMDLMIRSILGAFPGYLLTLIMLGGTLLLQSQMGGLALLGATGGKGSTAAPTFGTTMVVHVISVGGGLYCEIVAMRLIGLFYHHFKHRFAWSWG